jgi:hypothetical protein
MSELDRALAEITSIRMQVARNTVFRGYGPATLAATGGIATLAATLQQELLWRDAMRPGSYLAIWATTAVLSAAIVAVGMYTRTRRMHSGISHEMLGMAVEQFLPALGAGLLLTWVLSRFASYAGWMLPGLWQIVYSLGIFASCRFLPRFMRLAAAWYLASGLTCLAIGPTHALSPWRMGIPFAIGQMLIAAVLFVARQEENDDDAF